MTARVNLWKSFCAVSQQRRIVSRSLVDPAFAIRAMALGCAAGIASAASSPLAHRPLLAPGIHGYADQLSVQPGDTINFKISSDTNYTFQIFRLGLDVNSPSLDVSNSPQFTVMSPQQQPIYPGSYVCVTNGLPASNALAGLTLECWMRPSLAIPGGDEFALAPGFTGLMTQYDTNQAGFGLFVQLNDTNNGTVAFYGGDGGALRMTNWLQTSFDFIGSAQTWDQLQWHHVAATWDGATQSLWIDGQLAASHSFAGPVKPGPAPLRLGSYGENGLANHFYNGDLAFPVIYSNALSGVEISNHFSQVHPGGSPPQPFDTNNVPTNVLACWQLTEEGSNIVADISAFHRDGQIINHATWHIGGPSFDASKVGEFDSYDPATDPTRGHGLRLASDDLFDCGWTNTFSWVVSNAAPSGIYVARLRYPATAGTNAFYHHITFVVRKPDSRAPAPILLVFPLNTLLAYNSSPFRTNIFINGSLFAKEIDTGGISGAGPNPADFPQVSGYEEHHDGAPTAHIGLRMPLGSADPYADYGGGSYSHLTRATRFTQVWLDQNGYSYDVITDLDLHQNPAALRAYRAVILAGHSEYWSVAAYNNLKTYLQNHGNLVVLSGNTMYWRVSYNADSSVMEVRKVDGVGGQYAGRRGEVWHSDDGLRGGLMRENGFPGWQLIGLDTLGILDTRETAAFSITNGTNFLFSGLGVTNGQMMCVGYIGHESDARIATLNAARQSANLGVSPNKNNSVPPVADPVEPPGIVPLALGIATNLDLECNPDQFLYFDYYLQDLCGHVQFPAPVADLIYWERLDGGRVFNAGSIASGAALSNDPIFAGVVRNVLDSFTAPDTWVDFNWTGSQNGTFDFPFKTLAGGLNAAPWGSTLRIKAGHTTETNRISKRLLINSYGGTATLGK
jgi:hypothetical protein